MDRIWSSIQNLSSRFEENVRLLELLQAEKEEKVFLRRTIEEKDYLINDLNEQLRKLESQRISLTGDSQQADWEKPKKAVKNVFPPTWEMPTTNRFNDLDFEDNDIPEDNNAPDDSFEIQLSDVKLKRKIQYLQTKVRSSEPSVEHYSDNIRQPFSSTKQTSQKQDNLGSTTRTSDNEEPRTSTKKERKKVYQRADGKSGSNNVTYVVGDSMLNGMDERKMSNRKRLVKVRAHPGANILDMADYLKPILRKKPKFLILHVGTNDIKNSSRAKIMKHFEEITEPVSRNSPSTKLILSSIIMRNDDGKLNDEIGHVNELLKNLCDSKGVFYIDRNCLQKGGLHLNRTGTMHLSMNFKQFLKSL